MSELDKGIEGVTLIEDATLIEVEGLKNESFNKEKLLSSIEDARESVLEILKERFKARVANDFGLNSEDFFELLLEGSDSKKLSDLLFNFMLVSAAVEFIYSSIYSYVGGNLDYESEVILAWNNTESFLDELPGVNEVTSGSFRRELFNMLTTRSLACFVYEGNAKYMVDLCNKMKVLGQFV